MTLWLFVFSFIVYALANAHTYSDQRIDSDLALIKTSSYRLLSQNNDGSLQLVANTEGSQLMDSLYRVCKSDDSNNSVQTTLNKNYSIDLISCGQDSSYQIILITNKKRTEVLDLHLFKMQTSVLSTAHSLKLGLESKYFFKADGLLNSDEIIFNLNGIKTELVRNIKSQKSSFFLISGMTLENTSNLIKGLFKKATHTVLEKYTSDYNDRLNQDFPLMHKNVSTQNLLTIDSISFSVIFVFDDRGIELAE